MISQSISACAPLSFCPCKIDGLQNQRVSNLFFLTCGKRKRSARVVPWKKSQPNISVFVCSFPTNGRDSNLNLEVANSVAARGAKNFVVKTFSKEFEKEEEEELSQQSSSNIHLSRHSNNFNSFQEDPIVYNLRTQLGVIHPMPSPQINRNIVGLFVFFFFVGVAFDKIWSLRKRKKSSDESRPGAWPQVPTSFSLFLEKDLQRKESVEWVNMVLGKLWKVYRAEIENWIIGLLQPIIDNLKKPDYVQRVEIKQFSLGDEPLSVRNVERRTSRRDNDLQYQIGLRYTGGARMLLMLSLKFSVIPIVVPVGVRDFDIDGELWVKLRLIPSQPWVGAASWAFVSLPKIKFELSPFRLFNIMAIPVLSMFLTKLLTEDLPRLFVRPNKIVLDFQKGKAVGPVPNDLKTGELIEGSKDFVGELSVTLVDARNLSYIFYGKTDPYVTLSLGDQLIRSKKNSQTTIIGPPGKPIWNQDFHMLVTNPRKQKLYIQVKDSLGFTDLRVGIGEVDIASLEDTVPTDRIVVLRGGWGLFGKGSSGEILLRLTYKAYVEDEEDEKTGVDTDDELSDSDESYSRNERDFSGADKESFMDVLAALIISEKFQGIVSSETGKSFEDSKNGVSKFSKTSSKAPVPGLESSASILDTDSKGSRGSPLVLLTVITSLALLISLSLGGSNLFNP